jgi:hypothetical protein
VERHPVVATNEAGREPAAAEDCGNDRRCRLDRLKRETRARRVSQRLHDEKVVDALVAEQEKARLEKLPRIAKPWILDQRSSLFGVLGLNVGYTFARYAQIQTSYMHSSADVYFQGDLDRGLGGWPGWLSTHWWTTGVSVFPYTGLVTPYVSAAFARVWGDLDSEYGVTVDVPQPDGSMFVEYQYTSRQLEVVLHAIELGAGVDLQTQIGFHARLGAIYRAPVYVQARTGPGEYDPDARQSVRDWYDENARIDFVLLLGWAF